MGVPRLGDRGVRLLVADRSPIPLTAAVASGGFDALAVGIDCALPSWAIRAARQVRADMMVRQGVVRDADGRAHAESWE